MSLGIFGATLAGCEGMRRLTSPATSTIVVGHGTDTTVLRALSGSTGAYWTPNYLSSQRMPPTLGMPRVRRTVVRTADDAVVLDPASDPELCITGHPFHTHSLGLTS